MEYSHGGPSSTKSFTELISRFAFKKPEPAPGPSSLALGKSLIQRKLEQATLLGIPTKKKQQSRPLAATKTISKKSKNKTTTCLVKVEEEDGMFLKEQDKRVGLLEAALAKRKARHERLDKVRAEAKKLEFERRKRKLRQLLQAVKQRNEFPQPAWVPPRSPHRLIQEKLYNDPWKMIVACIFLHRTTGTQMRRVLWKFFELFPRPQAVIDAPVEQLVSVLKPLGLFNKRAQLIQRFSHEYLYTNWTDIAQLHGVGAYADDAYKIFVDGRWREVVPDDAMLDKYWEWLHETQPE